MRELENLILRLCMRSDATTIDLADLAAAEPLLWGEGAAPSAAATPPATAAVQAAGHAGDVGTANAAAGLSRFAAAKRHAIEHFERDYLIALMRRADGNVSRAALLSGTERRQLGKLLKRHGIERHFALDA